MSILLLVALPALPIHAAPVLRNPLPIDAAPTYLTDLVPADFNGDGYDDLLLVSPVDSLGVLLNNGSGPFAPPVVSAMPYFSGGSPGTGDVNEDGKIDVVVSNSLTATVHAFFGDGQGALMPGPASSTLPHPGPVAVADFNGDHHLDVVVATSDPHSTTNLLGFYSGDGTGRFSHEQLTQVGFRLTGLSPVDMNGDGKMDLLANNAGLLLVLFLGDGRGGFSADALFDGNEAVVGHFNHDQHLDVASVVDGYFESHIEVQLGNGDGTFTLATRYPSGQGSRSITTADVDGDGRLDLLAAGMEGSAVAVLRGRGDGSFLSPQYFLSGPRPYAIVANDFDRDGKVDFATLESVENKPIMSFVRGLGDGTFESYRSFRTTPPDDPDGHILHATGNFLEDVNHDGTLDVIVAQDDPSDFSSDIGVLLNDGTGKLSTPILSNADPWGSKLIAAGDVTSDGFPDVVYLSTDYAAPSATVLLGDGSGRLLSSSTFPTARPDAIALDQFDDDLALDLLVAGFGSLAVYPGAGDGTFHEGIKSSPAYGTLLAVGDMDRDGTMDCVLAEARGVSSCLNDGTGHFTCSSVSSEDLGVSGGALADFDGDTVLDLLLVTYTGTQFRTGRGDGTFGPPLDFRLQPVPYDRGTTVRRYQSSTAIADFDSDGKLDVAFGTTVYLGNSDGTFRSRSRLRRPFPVSTHVGDMDQNGTPDLVTTNGAADSVDVLLTGTTDDPTEPSSIELSSDVDVAEYGHPVTLTAQVTGSTVPLTGAVLFTVNGHPSGLIDVANDGSAELTTGFDLGTHDVSVRYTGDENYLDSTTSMTLTSVRATPEILVSGYPNPQHQLDTVWISVYVYAPLVPGPNPFARPTGTIDVYDGDTFLTTLAPGLDFSRFRISTLSPGDHLITARYSGDEHFEAATSSYTQQIVLPTTITALDPDSGPTTGGQSVRITGTGLVGVLGVGFGGRWTDEVVEESTTSLQVVTPPSSAVGPADVVVRTSLGDLARLDAGFTYLGAADLRISTEIVSPPPHTAGQTISLQLSVANDGPQSAEDVLLTKDLPNGLQMASSSPSQGECRGATTLECSLGTIANGENAVVMLTVRLPPHGGTMVSRAAVRSDQIDPRPENNSASITVEVLGGRSIPTLSAVALVLFAGLLIGVGVLELTR